MDRPRPEGWHAGAPRIMVPDPSGLAVQASVAPNGDPQAAVVGFAVTNHLEIIFDTVETSRKYANLRADPRVALVIG